MNPNLKCEKKKFFFVGCVCVCVWGGGGGGEWGELGGGLYLGRDKLAIFTITVYVNIIVYMYLYIDACAQVFSAI